MAIKDIKSLEVAPEDEEKTIQLWQCFGWEMKSTQRVKTQDAQMYTGQNSDRTTSYYETTKGVDFFELTFERDPERNNYAELVELEKQYYTPLPSIPAPASISNPTPPSPPERPGRIGIGWGILAVIGLFLGFVPGIIIIIWRLVSYPMRLKSWKQKNDEYEKALPQAEKAHSEAVLATEKARSQAENARAEAEKALSEAKKKRSDALEKARSIA